MTDIRLCEWRKPGENLPTFLYCEAYSGEPYEFETLNGTRWGLFRREDLPGSRSKLYRPDDFGLGFPIGVDWQAVEPRPVEERPGWIFNWQGHTWQIIEVLWEYRLYVCDRLVWKESSMVESSDDKASPWDAHYRIDPITVGGEILEQKTDQLEARLVALEKAVSHLSKAVMVLSRVIDYNMKLDGKS